MLGLRKSPRALRANTLLELVAAATIIAVALVPGLRMIGDALQQSRRNEALGLLTNYCVGKLEQQLCQAAASWTEGTTTGDFSTDGYPQYRFSAVRSQQAIDGGLPNQLMAVVVTVYHDVNGDAAYNAGEPRIVLASKVAKMAKYQSEAAGS